MYVYIGGTNRTDKIIKDSIVITDELQERVNSAEFRMYGLKPTDMDDVKIFEGFPIYSFTSSSITLQKKYAQAILNNIFRSGDTIYVNAPNDTTMTVSSITEDVKGYISGIVTNYPFLGNANDNSGNGFNGFLTGSPTLTANQLNEPNSAYRLNGTSQIISTPSLTGYTNVPGYTVCFWFKPNTKLTRSRPITSQASSWVTGFYGNAGGSGKNYTWFVGSGSAFSAGRTAASFITFGSWQFVAITFDKTTGILYKNGVQFDTQAYAPATLDISGGLAYGGTASVADLCDGDFGELTIFNRALTANEILAKYNEGIGRRTTPGYVKLNFTSNFTTLPTVGNIAGKKKFAGNILETDDENDTVLTNVEFDVKCLDYTRIFDKKNINDTYENVTARYIVNDFCNVTVNPNQELDPFSYADNAAIQAAWIESGDGGNPTIDTTNFREGTRAGSFPWTFAGGTATFTDTITAVNASPFTGVSSGTPTKGRVGFWYKCADYTKITTFVLRVGSDSGNYIQSPAIDPTSNEWTFYDFPIATATKVGTPVWTAVDYMALVITETASSSIIIDGIRMLENDFFRHYPYVQEGITLEDFRVSRVKPTEVMQRLADTLAWYWYVDYNRYIRLFPQSTLPAPISLTPTSNNFANLSINADTTRLINRQVVRASDETSTSDYSQVIQGDGVTREWLMKTSFANLSVKLNDGTSTDTMEATTTTTTVKATAHGLSVGDYIVNRTRSNAVREVLTVPDANTFTVAAVTSQASGDTFSLFVAQTVGVEGIDVEASYDYMSNFTEKSIRASSAEGTLVSGQFLLFTYNEVIPILVQRTDNVSVANIKNLLGYGDGIFDGQPITDKSIKTRFEAMALADATINKYSNTIITARFTTEQEGLEAGQIISIQDTGVSQRSINQSFVIQSVRMRQLAWGENRYTVVCSSLLFGMVELLQQMLSANRKVAVDENEVINNIEDANETLTITDSTSSSNDGQISTETLTISDSVTSDEVVPPFLWGNTGGGATEFQWQLSAWG